MKLLIVVLLSALLTMFLAHSQAKTPGLNNQVSVGVKPTASAKKPTEVKAPTGVKQAKTKAAVRPTKSKAKLAAAKPRSKPKPPVANQVILAKAGIPRQDWPAVSYIFSHESSWRPAATNSIGCKGLGQSCATNLEADCPNWRNNPVCQAKHFDRYAVARYGSWASAKQFWVANHWW